MRSAIGFGIVVTAALVALEYGSGRGLYRVEPGPVSAPVSVSRDGIGSQAVGVSNVARPVTSVDAASVSVYDPIPTIARTIAVADPSPATVSTAAALETGSVTPQVAGDAPTADPATKTAAEAGRSDAIVPPAPRTALSRAGSTGSKADRLATALGPAPSSKVGQSVKTAKSTKSANSDKLGKTAKAKAGKVPSDKIAKSKSAKSRNTAKSGSVKSTVARVTIKRGTVAQLVTVRRGP